MRAFEAKPDGTRCQPSDDKAQASNSGHGTTASISSRNGSRMLSVHTSRNSPPSPVSAVKTFSSSSLHFIRALCGSVSYAESSWRFFEVPIDGSSGESRTLVEVECCGVYVWIFPMRRRRVRMPEVWRRLSKPQIAAKVFNTAARIDLQSMAERKA